MYCFCWTLSSVSIEEIRVILINLLCRKITEAVGKQMSTLGHVSNIYYHSKLHEYAEKLTSKFPGDLKVPTITLCSV